MNILYEDYDGIKVRCIISTNLHDFYEPQEDIEKNKEDIHYDDKTILY